MNRTRMFNRTLSRTLLVAVIGSVAIVGCKKKEEAAATPPPTAVEPAPAPEPLPAPAATASIASVEIGSAVDTAMKVTTATASFKPKDTVYVSIATATSDPAATVAGKVGAKLTYMNGTEEMVVSDETRDLNLTDKDATHFQFAKPDGWPAGKYKIAVTLDGNVVQTREFDVAK
jgi:hypothetical protein